MLTPCSESRAWRTLVSRTSSRSISGWSLIFLGILAFLWGVVILLARYRRVQSVAVGVLIAITSIATPVGILVFGSLLARSAGGVD